MSGPFDRWPTHSGFDKFYGFIGGETNQWAPLIFDGTVKVEAPGRPELHFTTDMTNQAIAWIKPAIADPGQAILHVLCHRCHACAASRAEDWIAKFKGKFDGGWDKYREETFARQKQMGIIRRTRSWRPSPPTSRTGRS